MARAAVRTWAPWCALVVLAAVAVGTLGDIRVGSGSDAAGKLATARVMADRSTCDPDIGWWAADVDPDAELHQLLNTELVGDRYVQATSPVYQCVVMPLQRALGPWGPVAVSILGAVAAALAAAAITAGLGGDRTGQRAAFVLVGLAGPVFHYATDVWEHAPAVGAMTTGVALVLGPPTPRRAALAGVAFGVATVLRGEMVPYIAALALSGLAIGEVRRRWLRAPAAVVAGLVGAAAVVVANLVAERALVSGSVRAGRSADLAGGVLDQAGERASTAAVTGIGFLDADDAVSILFAAALVALVLVAARPVVTGRERSALEPAGGLFALRWAGGVGFVPGVLVASPFALAGVWTGSRSAQHRWLVATALGALPLVWILQWPGNLVAQWGGRYVLMTGVLLTAAGCAAMSTVVGGWRRAAPLLVSCAAIGLLSAAWHVERTVAVGNLVDVIEDVPADSVIVTTDVNLAREAGGTYGEVRWLAVGNGEGILANEVIFAHDPANLTLVRRRGEAPLALLRGYSVVGTIEVTELGETWIVDRLARDD